MITKQTQIEYEDKPFFIYVPTQCPCCNVSIVPYILSKHCNEHSFRTYTYENFCIIYQCPHCDNVFFTVSRVLAWNNSVYLTAEPSIYPTPSQSKDFDPYIQEISSQFINIYNQAYKAEQNGFDEICGVGYRKALEFLVKDYAIVQFPDDKDKICNEFISATINRFEDTALPLKNIASRATWLGNDQTHYVQKFSDNDISDLKKLIDMTVHWILLIHNTEEVTANITYKK